MVGYEGIFFDKETTNFIFSIEKQHLEVVNDEIHCTFKYRPNNDELFNDIVGTEVDVLIIGYACDGQNSGFLIKIPEEYMKYYINYDEDNPNLLKVTHITASLAKGASASNTKNLKFELFDKPYLVRGKFGYWIKKDDVNGYVSFEKYGIEQRM